MLSNSMHLDPWLKTVQLLNVLSAQAGDEQFVSPCGNDGGAMDSWVSRRRLCSFRAASIKILGRSGVRSATISWCDPTMCNYPDQVWEMKVAARPGTCALSGSAIRRGDSVFRPRCSRARPANATAMIHAGLVNKALSDLTEE
ncbi:DUF3331 domain-containing protein [Paraburkholderia sp. BL25I1N1]|uniref:DUF3331 domain-containing protein n=1 Tax=Paraburkholderia sp. BL25I1N1 TaxID=1938804 RepID=UPI000D0788A9|nr:DUF3331 domain-containing protein [Paraburkholderia sp. BL25I1N1]PRY04463.1 uncharacterized protein DUF3331 [Paraburkholderia sp. BL25I1N1]